MRIGILGSRSVTVDWDELDAFILNGLCKGEEHIEIVSGGAKGVDTCAREWAEKRGLPFREFLPDYARYKRGAPMKRNREIVEYCDFICFFWDGKSRGSRATMKLCDKLNVFYVVVCMEQVDGNWEISTIFRGAPLIKHMNRLAPDLGIGF